MKNADFCVIADLLRLRPEGFLQRQETLISLEKDRTLSTKRRKALRSQIYHKNNINRRLLQRSDTVQLLMRQQKYTKKLPKKLVSYRISWGQLFKEWSAKDSKKFSKDKIRNIRDSIFIYFVKNIGRLYCEQDHRFKEKKLLEYLQSIDNVIEFFKNENYLEKYREKVKNYPEENLIESLQFKIIQTLIEQSVLEVNEEKKSTIINKSPKTDLTVSLTIDFRKIQSTTSIIFAYSLPDILINYCNIEKSI